MTEKKEVQLFTDGACSGNPGPGGWGAILRYKGQEKELSGGEPMTTNNRMELLAAIEGLSALKQPCRVTLTSDSKYLVDAVTKGWVYGWQKKRLEKKRQQPRPECRPVGKAAAAAKVSRGGICVGEGARRPPGK